MKKLIFIFLLPTLLSAQVLLLGDLKSNDYWLNLDGSTEYKYVDKPVGLDLKSADYLADSNSVFTGTVTSDWVASGDIAISFASDKMVVEATGHTSSDYINITGSNFTTSFVNDCNYTIQPDLSSLASSDIEVLVGTHVVDTISTNTVLTTYAITFKYDSDWGTGVSFRPLSNDTYTFDNVDVSEAYDLEIEGWFNSNGQDGMMFNFDVGVTSNGLYLKDRGGGLVQMYYTDGTSSVSQNLGFTENAWVQYSITIDGSTNTITTLVGSNSDSDDISHILPFTVDDALYIGRNYYANRYFNGSIGKLTFTRTRGNGEVTGTTIYNWKGTSDTFLNDKGTNGNDLTGVNITIDDVEKGEIK